MATNTDEDLLTPTAPLTSTNFPVDITAHPSLDLTLMQRQVIYPIPLSTDSLCLPQPPGPPGFDANILSAAALSVAQLRGSDFVDPMVLWAPTHQQL